jgi:hypothetical protein
VHSPHRWKLPPVPGPLYPRLFFYSSYRFTPYFLACFHSYILE